MSKTNLCHKTPVSAVSVNAPAYIPSFTKAAPASGFVISTTGEQQQQQHLTTTHSSSSLLSHTPVSISVLDKLAKANIVSERTNYNTPLPLTPGAADSVNLNKYTYHHNDNDEDEAVSKNNDTNSHKA